MTEKEIEQILEQTPPEEREEMIETLNNELWQDRTATARQKNEKK